MLPPSSGLKCTLKMEAAKSSKMSVANHHTTLLNNSENHIFYLHHLKNLKSHNLNFGIQDKLKICHEELLHINLNLFK
jgi:hypothetical protein